MHILIRFAIVAVLLCMRCTLSPSRKLIPKGHWETEVALSVLPGSEDAGGYPAVPNANIGFRYGITDRVNAGLSMNPLTLLVDGIIMAEPYAAFGVLKSWRWLPALNANISFPLLISPSDLDAVCFPLIGITPVYAHNRWRWYMTGELAFDDKTFERGLDVHANIRSGTILALREHLEVALEWGIADIGRESLFTNNDYGQGIVSLGFSYDLTARRNRESQ